MAFGVITQFALGALAPAIVADLDAGPSEIGATLTVLFLLVTVGSPVAGAVVDRVGGTAPARIALVAATAALGTIAAAQGLALLLVGAVLAALALALANPATNRLIAVSLPTEARGGVVAVSQSGVQAGALLAGGLGLIAATAAGWRGALVIGAALALAGLPSLARVHAPTRSPVATPPERDRWPAGPTQRTTWWLAAYALLMGAGMAAVFGYLPLYGSDVVGLSAGAAGALTGVMGAAGLASRLAFATVADRLGHVQPHLAGLAFGAASALALLQAATPARPWLAWAAATLLGLTAVAWPAVAMIAVVRPNDPTRAGRMSGWVIAALYAGLVVSPLPIATIIERAGYRLAWAASAAAFLVAAAVAAAWLRTSRTAERSASASTDTTTAQTTHHPRHTSPTTAQHPRPQRTGAARRGQHRARDRRQ